MKIDFHNHYYPPEYLAAVKTGPTRVRMDYDAEGNPRLHYPGDYNILVPGHRDLDYREGVLQKHGVDKQVITFTTPGTHFEEPATAVAMARHINDAFSTAVKQRQHFLSLATLPLAWYVYAQVVVIRHHGRRGGRPVVNPTSPGTK